MKKEFKIAWLKKEFAWANRSGKSYNEDNNKDGVEFCNKEMKIIKEILKDYKNYEI